MWIRGGSGYIYIYMHRNIYIFMNNVYFHMCKNTYIIYIYICMYMYVCFIPVCVYRTIYTYIHVHIHMYLIAGPDDEVNNAFRLRPSVLGLLGASNCRGPPALGTCKTSLDAPPAGS